MRGIPYQIQISAYRPDQLAYVLSTHFLPIVSDRSQDLQTLHL